MGEFKGTIGEAKVEIAHTGGIDSPLSMISTTVWKEYDEEKKCQSGWAVFQVDYMDDYYKHAKPNPDRDKEDAQLICDAFNVRQTIPFSITELKERYDELLMALKNSTSEILKSKQHHNNPNLKSVVDRNEELINKNK